MTDGNPRGQSTGRTPSRGTVGVEDQHRLEQSLREVVALDDSIQTPSLEEAVDGVVGALPVVDEPGLVL